MNGRPHTDSSINFNALKYTLRGRVELTLSLTPAGRALTIPFVNRVLPVRFWQKRTTRPQRTLPQINPVLKIGRNDAALAG